MKSLRYSCLEQYPITRKLIAYVISFYLMCNFDELKTAPETKQ